MPLTLVDQVVRPGRPRAARRTRCAAPTAPSLPSCSTAGTRRAPTGRCEPATGRVDRGLDGEGAAGLLDVQVLDHAAVDGDDALAGGLGLLEGGDDAAGLLDLLGARGEGGVARLDLARVDEGLAVEAEVAALLALGEEAGLVLDVVVDAVEDHLAGGPGGEQAEAEARRAAAGGRARARPAAPWPGRWCPSRARRAARTTRRSRGRRAWRSASRASPRSGVVGRAAGLEGLLDLVHLVGAS